MASIAITWPALRVRVALWPVLSSFKLAVRLSSLISGSSANSILILIIPLLPAITGFLVRIAGFILVS